MASTYHSLLLASIITHEQGEPPMAVDLIMDRLTTLLCIALKTNKFI